MVAWGGKSCFRLAGISTLVCVVLLKEREKTVVLVIK